MTHLAPLIRDLALILCVAALVTLIFQKIRQPVVLGYVLAGWMVSSRIHGLNEVKVWADLGVVFLMFSLGLEFSFRKLSRVGLSAATTATFEVGLMQLLGFGTGKLLGWKTMDCIFLGAMISISSTTIIIKALDELQLKSRRFAEMIFGVLIVEDLIAILILVALSTMAVSSSFSGVDLIIAAAKLVLVVGSWFLAGYFVVPRFIRYVGRIGSDEILTIVALALCLGMVWFAAKLHYSVALGAFIMGSILAESTESYRIEELIRPLRDLFAAIFFVSVGMLIDLQALSMHWHEVAIITCVLIFGKITAITLSSLITGQTLRTSVQVGFGMAQIGEFSFIIATLGAALGVTSPHLYALAVVVSVISTFTTPYLIKISHKFAVKLEGRLPSKLKHVLSKYAAWTLQRRAGTAKRMHFYSRALKWFLNGILVTVIFVLVHELLEPLLQAKPIVAWVIAVGLSAPFFWAMAFSFKGMHFGAGETRASGAGILFISRFLCVLWMGLLSLEFFNLTAALFITTGAAGLLFLFFHKQIGTSYQWFEQNFLSTFEPSQKTKKTTDVFRHLAPWDANLVRFKVHPNSEIAGKTISETNLREKHGVNVVVIQRGLKTIVAPQPHEQVFPKDELLVLGLDTHLESTRMMIEKPPGLGERFKTVRGYELQQIILAADSPLVGHSIKDSGIREKFGAMVVGLEREETRNMSPNSSVVLRAGDLLWVVGESEKIKELR